MRSIKTIVAFVAIAASVTHGSSAAVMGNDSVLSVSVSLRGEFTLETRPLRMLVLVDGSALAAGAESTYELLPTGKKNVYSGDISIAANHVQFTLAFDLDGEVVSEMRSDSRTHVVFVAGGRADVAFNCTPSRKCVSNTNKKGVIVDKYQQIVTALGVSAPPEYSKYVALQELDEASEADLPSKESEIPAVDGLEYTVSLADRYDQSGDKERALELLQQKRNSFTDPIEKSHIDLKRALIQLRNGQTEEGLSVLDNIVANNDLDIPIVQRAVVASSVIKLQSRSNDAFAEASKWVAFAHDPDDFSQKQTLDPAHSYSVLLSLGMAYWKSRQLALAENAFRQARQISSGARQREATRLYYEMMLERGAAVEVINDIGDLESVKGRRPDQALGRYFRMLAFEQLGAEESSVAEKEILLADFPNSVYAIQIVAKEAALSGVQQ